MMSAVRDPARHNPRARPRHIEELRLTGPPRFLFRAQNSKPLIAIFRVTFHEFHSRLGLWQRRRTHIDAQHIAKPQVFSHAWMHHLFPNAAPAIIAVARPAMHIVISEFTPRADNFE